MPPDSSPSSAASGVSVVIPARDVADVIGGQLAALARQRVDVPWEVVVADNGSTDRTADVVRGWADRLPVRVVDASDRLTSAHARNTGAAAARHDLLVLCDADDVVDDGWLAAHVAALADAPLVTGPVSFARLNAPEVIASRPSDWSAAPPVGNGFMPFALTCNLGVRREVFEALGGFDASRNHGNDKVFSWSAQLDGHDLGWAPDAVVHYRLRPDVAGTWRRQYRIGRAAPSLHRRFRDAGMPTDPLTRVARDWLWLAAALPRLGDPTRRYEWAYVAGRRAGRLVGSLRTRTRYL